MKKISTKFISVFISLIMVFSCSVVASASIYDEYGTCGDGVTWEYRAAMGILVISGNGEMYDYFGPAGENSRPYDHLHDKVNYIIIEEGVIYIGQCAFNGFTNVTSVSIPESLLAVGGTAFSDCTSLGVIDLGKNVIAVGPFAFNGCRSLNRVWLSSQLRYVGRNAFFGCPMTCVIHTGIPAQAAMIEYEYENEKIENLVFADTQYDLVVPKSDEEYGVFVVVDIEPFTLSVEDNGCVEVAEIAYETITEDGIDYYGAAVMVYGKEYGMTKVEYLNKNGQYAGVYTIMVMCDEHRFGENTVLIPSNCGTTGVEYHECEVCGHNETNIIPHSPNHKLEDPIGIVPANCEEAGEEVYVCERCEQYVYVEIPALGHDWNDWVVTVEPTEETAGSQTRTCKNCDKTETVIIPCTSVIPGDVTGDGKVNSLDARWILQYVARLKDFDEKQLMAADMTGDGKINALDARKALQKSAGII